MSRRALIAAAVMIVAAAAAFVLWAGGRGATRVDLARE